MKNLGNRARFFPKFKASFAEHLCCTTFIAGTWESQISEILQFTILSETAKKLSNISLVQHSRETTIIAIKQVEVQKI